MAIAWGFVASAIALWVNKLIDNAFPEAWLMLLIVPCLEEIAKYLGIRAVRRFSLVVPLVFLVNEAVIQSFSPFTHDPMTALVFSVLIGLMSLKHILFYVPIYLARYKPYGLIVAIAMHALWNWYADMPTGQDAIPLSLITLFVTIMPIWGLYHYNKREV